MWIATKLGFYSIVFKPSHLDPDGPPAYIVRARDREDLQRLMVTSFLQKDSETLASTKKWLDDNIYSYANSDYPYRVILQEAEFSCVIETLKNSITYDNFKNEIEQTPHQSRKLDPYKRLWTDLYNEHFDLRIKP